MPDHRQAFQRSLWPASRAAQAKQGRSYKWALGLTISGLLVAAGAFGMVQPSKVELPEQRLVIDTLNVPVPPLATSTDSKASEDYVVETRIQSGDTVSTILSRLGVSEPGLIQFVTVNRDARAAYRLFPGRTVQATLDGDGSMKWIRYYHTPGAEEKGEHVSRYLEISKGVDGSFGAQEHVDSTESQMHIAAGTIESSLFGATDVAGVPDGITIQIAEILGGKIDFLRDLRKGDEFRVIYETRTHEGRPAGAGRVLAVEFINKDKVFEALWFAADGSSGGGYYDSEGKSLKGAFLRNPIAFSRISSTFGGRRHPIHQQWSQHNGVDFAAPTGTPIRASADGVVESIGWQNGYGNTIVLRHPNNITTLFAHQSRFAKGLKRGDRVSQGELIGYVGSTGWSTGPHLHYELRVAGKPIDPMSVAVPESVALDAQQRAQFVASAGPLREQLQKLAELQKADPDVLLVAAR